MLQPIMMIRFEQESDYWTQNAVKLKHHEQSNNANWKIIFPINFTESLEELKQRNVHDLLTSPRLDIPIDHHQIKWRQ